MNEKETVKLNYSDLNNPFALMVKARKMSLSDLKSTVCSLYKIANENHSQDFDDKTESEKLKEIIEYTNESLTKEQKAEALGIMLTSYIACEKRDGEP